MDSSVKDDLEEYAEIGKILLDLLNQDLITEIEGRLIASAKQLSERKLAIYTIIETKDESEATAILRVLRNRSNVAKNGRKHSLLNAVVSKTLFGFLPLEDIFNCRLVCQDWYSTAEPIVRKQATITFRKLQPSNFIEVFELSFLGIPFTSFKFPHKEIKWKVSEIDEFFNKWGKYIRELKFHSINMEDLVNPGQLLRNFDITPWIVKAPNVEKLNCCCLLQPFSSIIIDTVLSVQADKLLSVKSLSLIKSRLILTDDPEENIKISPHELILTYVSFSRNNEILKNICLNDFIDFSVASTIDLSSGNATRMTFDMASQIFKAQSLYVRSCELRNWEGAKGNIEFLTMVDSSFIEKNNLQIEKIYLQSSVVNFAVLPESIKQIRLGVYTVFVCNEPFQLPNLTYLKVEHDSNEDFNRIRHFANCANLTRIELGCRERRQDTNVKCTLNLNWIPKTVKSMKINYRQLKILGDDDDSYVEMDTLVLEGYLDSLLTEVVEMISKIQPKVLIVIRCSRDILKDTTDIIKFLLLNPQLETFIVSGVLNTNTLFETSILSRFVDKKANTYIFQKEIGRALRGEEFDKWKCEWVEKLLPA